MDQHVCPKFSQETFIEILKSFCPLNLSLRNIKFLSKSIAHSVVLQDVVQCIKEDKSKRTWEAGTFIARDQLRKLSEEYRDKTCEE